MFQVHYSKPDTIDLSILEKQYLEQNVHTNMLENTFSSTTPNSPFTIQQLQLYNPVYHKFFQMNSKNFDKIALNHCYHIQDMSHVKHIETGELVEKPVFIKFSPLLDTFRYMTGKYNIDDPRIYSLPQLESTEETVHSKILSPNNASYVDCFFNFLSSSLLHKHGIVHGIDFYGSFLGLQENYKVCVTDDLDYLRGSDFFQKHLGTLFRIEDPLHHQNILGDHDERDGLMMGGSRRNKRKLRVKSEDNLLLDCDILDDAPITELSGSIDVLDLADEVIETVYTKRSPSVVSNTSTSNTSDTSEVDYSSDEEDAKHNHDQDGLDEKGTLDIEDVADDNDWQTESNSENSAEDTVSDEEEHDDDDEQELYGYIKQFPIQMICLEKCDGTMDELLVRDELDEAQGASALFQIVMTLLIYQKAFRFTHNDLHTNNIMYMNTDIKHVYYRFANKTYKVPTYGRIYKIIDFGRSIYKFQDHLFCSDSFASGGDAATQYNFEPFMNGNKPRLEPNFAFDLCRLGTSMYDFLIDNVDDYTNLDEFQKTIYRWCLDDHGKNVLYKKNGEERYPNFKLYKMIARTVHEHRPEAQLEYAFFSQFATKEKVDFANVIDIDVLPVYTSKIE